MFFIRFGKFSSIIPLNTLSAPFLSFLFLWFSLCICWYHCRWWFPTGLWCSVYFILFSFIFFLFSRLDNFYWSFIRITDSFSASSNLLLSHSSEFFQLYYFLIPEFLFASLYYFWIFINILCKKTFLPCFLLIF